MQLLMTSAWHTSISHYTNHTAATGNPVFARPTTENNFKRGPWPSINHSPLLSMHCQQDHVSPARPSSRSKKVANLSEALSRQRSGEVANTGEISSVKLMIRTGTAWKDTMTSQSKDRSYSSATNTVGIEQRRTDLILWANFRLGRFRFASAAPAPPAPPTTPASSTPTGTPRRPGRGAVRRGFRGCSRQLTRAALCLSPRPPRTKARTRRRNGKPAHKRAAFSATCPKSGHH